MKLDNCGCNPCKPPRSYSYAQYGVQSNPPSNTDLSMSVIFEEGCQISLRNSSEIVLAPGYLYLINFIFLATPEADSYMQITPEIDGVVQPLYSFFAPTGPTWRNSSASGSFTLPVSENNTILSFLLTYPSTVRNIDISGAISVTVLHRLETDRGC